MRITSFEARSRMSENLIGSFFYSFEGGAVYKLQKSKLEETINPGHQKKVILRLL